MTQLDSSETYSLKYELSQSIVFNFKKPIKMLSPLHRPKEEFGRTVKTAN